MFSKIINFFKRIFGIKTGYKKWKKETEESSSSLVVKEDFDGPSTYKEEVDLYVKANANDMIFDIFEFVTGKLITNAEAIAWNTFYTQVINGGVTELTQILSRLEDIDKKLDEMMNLYKNTTYESYINTRTKYVSEMVNAHTYYVQQLTSLDSEDEKVKKVLSDWSKSYIGGNSAMVQYQNFINFILDSKINTNTLYDVYDLYVYNTTAWEHQGYDYREQLRNMDFAAIATNAALSMLFIKSNPDIDDTVRKNQLDTVSKKLKQYCDYYDAHKVVRKDDKIICQINRTHFEMTRKLWTKDYVNHGWFKNGTRWESENQESSWCLCWGDDYGTIAGNNCGKELYKAERNRIVNYYGGDKSFWDIMFNEMKLEKPTDVDENLIYIPLATWTGDYPIDSSHREQSFGEVVTKNNNNITKEALGIVKIDHTGFLWLTDTFRGWDNYYSNKKWYFTNVITRDADNWKD